MRSSVEAFEGNAHKINQLWSEIYRLWKQADNHESTKSHNAPDNERHKVIDIYSKLLDLISREADPHDYFFVLRKRAQYYGLTKKFNNALDDLYEEADYAWKTNDNIRAKECQELISQISVWDEAKNGRSNRAG